VPDIVTVTSREGCLSRIGQSIAGVFVGLLLVLASFPLLWWNEGRAVHRARSLEEGAGAVIDVPADPVSPANDGKLVHLSGLAAADQPVTDPDFGISAQAIRLERVAETYQWRETSSTTKRKRLGGSEETVTTYKYEKTWSRSHIDSSSFREPAGHENPPSLQWEPRTMTAARVTCEAFVLSPELIGKIGGSTDRPVARGDDEKMRAAGFTSSEGHTFYRRSPSNPLIGDVRVRFEVILPQTVSIVATQRGTTFEAYHAQAGSDILLLETGTVSAEEMFKSARTSNRILTWVLRAAGFLAMFLGFVLVLRPISVVGSVIPFVGSILAAGAGFVAFFCALALSLTTIALAWLAYRPLLGGGLLALAVASVVLLLRRRRQPRAVIPPPIPPPIPPSGR
jgi:hypothetical protein